VRKTIIVALMKEYTKRILYLCLNVYIIKC